MKKAIFIDKDGTLIPDIPFNTDPQKIMFNPYAGNFLKHFYDTGYEIVVISNQPGVARKLFTEDDLQTVSKRLQELAGLYDFRFSGFYYCIHDEGDECECRKPKPGLLLKAAAELKLSLQESWMIGDILHDIEAGKKAGCQTVLINNGGETEWKFTEANKPDLMVKDLYELFMALLGGVWKIQESF